VGNKQEILVACISARATRLKVPADLPVPRTRETLAQVLVSFGSQLVREITDPAVVTVFRLAIADAVRAPEVAQALDSIGREASRAALRQIMTQAQSAGLLEGRPAELAEQFGGLLWGNLLISLLLGVAEQPSSREIATRAREATAALLQLH
jgi:AcrR family transcriptional regulator